MRIAFTLFLDRIEIAENMKYARYAYVLVYVLLSCVYSVIDFGAGALIVLARNGDVIIMAIFPAS